MKRTTVMIPEDLIIRASKHANAVGISLGEFIRESLEKALKSNPAGETDLVQRTRFSMTK
jgi:predicted DNA binding CopG/RHH family protein